MEVVQYSPKYKQDFIQFNTDWIVENFGFLEKEDFEIFGNVEAYLAKGAMIFVAQENEMALATCMTMPLENGTWEIGKLASNKQLAHKGAGSAVFQAAMDWAIGHGATRLFLISNSKLKPAIHIYEKFGFHEIKMQDYEYLRGDIAFEYLVNPS
jgi:GNAT superfamily N-acetyltransferase